MGLLLNIDAHTPGWAWIGPRGGKVTQALVESTADQPVPSAPGRHGSATEDPEQGLGQRSQGRARRGWR